MADATPLRVDLGSEVFSVRFSPDDSLVAAGTFSGKVFVVNTKTGEIDHELAGVGAEMPVVTVRWRPACAQVKRRNILVTARGCTKDAASGDGAINHWHLKSRRCLHEIEEKGSQTYSLDYTADGAFFVSAGLDRQLRLYDEATKRLVSVLSGGNDDTCAGHSNRVYAVKFDPMSPHVVASAGWDHTMQIWDLRKGHAVRSVFGVYVCGDALDIMGDGSGHILTGSYRGKDALQVWDMGTGELVRKVAWEPHDSCSLFAARLGPAGSGLFAAGGIGAGEARVYSMDGEIKHRVDVGDRASYSLDFSSDASMLAVGDSGGMLHLHPLQA